jgi:hypothetical protein
VSLFLGLALAASAATQPPREDPELERGVVLAQQGDFELAVSALGKVARRLAAEGGPKQQRVRALVYLSVAYLGLDQESEATAQLVKALQVAPELQLTLREFPPKVVQFYERVRRQAAAAATPPPPSSAPVSSIGTAPLVFQRVDFFRTGDEHEEPLDARLTLDPESQAILIADEKAGRAKALYARIPFEAVTDLIHQVSKNRPWTTRPTKGKEHWLTIGFEKIADLPGGVVHMHLDKGNYRQVISAVESATGLMTATQIAR